jgi:hypothetical protein
MFVVGGGDRPPYNSAGANVMRTKTVWLVFLCVSSAWAGGLFQRASVISMQTNDCACARRSVLAALSGAADIRHELCAEYLLVSPSIVFRVQASKSAPLLLPAEEVSFRSGKGSLVLRRDDDQGEFEVKVLCMQLRNSRQGSCGISDDVLPITARNQR